MSAAASANHLARFAPPILGVLGAALVLLRQANFGGGLSWDSAYYLSAARSLVAGDGLVIWNGVQYVAAAPLFPHPARRRPRSCRPRGQVVPAIVISLRLAQQAGAVYRDAGEWLKDGAGYTSRYYIKSDVLRYLRAHPLGGPVWTSRRDGVAG